MRDFFGKVKGYLLRYAKICFPLLAMALTAIVVVVALRLRGDHSASAEEEPSVLEPIGQEIVEVIPVSEREIPLTENADEEIAALFERYYECLSNGDMDTLVALCDTVDEKTLLLDAEQAAYMDYEVAEIYTQDGPSEDSRLVYIVNNVILTEYPDFPLPSYDIRYVKRNDAGSYYIHFGDISNEEEEYILAAYSKDEVIELINRVTVEYNKIVLEETDILLYLKGLDTVINEAIAEKVAELSSAEEPEGTDAESGETGEDPGQEGSSGGETVPAGPLYGTVTTTVNVRVSDSTNADLAGQLAGGTRVEVLEQQLNGWTKIVYKDGTAFVKSEFIYLAESAEDVEVIGTVTTTSAVNIRIAPDANSERLGVAALGETLDLIERLDGWCKIIYNGQIAYVSEDYVE